MSDRSIDFSGRVVTYVPKSKIVLLIICKYRHDNFFVETRSKCTYVWSLLYRYRYLVDILVNTSRNLNIRTYVRTYRIYVFTCDRSRLHRSLFDFVNKIRRSFMHQNKLYSIYYYNSKIFYN